VQVVNELIAEAVKKIGVREAVLDVKFKEAGGGGIGGGTGQHETQS
jgi:hypothetical protein